MVRAASHLALKCLLCLRLRESLVQIHRHELAAQREPHLRNAELFSERIVASEVYPFSFIFSVQVRWSSARDRSDLCQRQIDPSIPFKVSSTIPSRYSLTDKQRNLEGRAAPASGWLWPALP